MVLTHFEMLARIAGGAALGGVIGYERDRHKRPVGLRTHTIVAMTAATFMVVSAQFAYFQGYTEGGIVDVDGSRIAASVVSAVGFLAGGDILRSGASIQGLTTAAGLWLVTAIGLCAGGGMYVEAAGVTALGIVVLTLFRRFEDKDDGVLRKRISVVIATGGRGPLFEALAALGVAVTDVQYDQRLDDKPRIELTFDARIPDKVGVSKVLDAIEATAEVRRIRIEGAG